MWAIQLQISYLTYIHRCYINLNFLQQEGQNELQKDAIGNKLQGILSNAPYWEDGIKKAMETCFDESRYLSFYIKYMNIYNYFTPCGIAGRLEWI